MDEVMAAATVEAVKAVAKDVYEDGAKPAVQATGKLIGLVPRAINAALSPLEKWILQSEYNVEETKHLLAKKLENVSPDLIEPPEAHVAVPAMQYISYCMDNEELRDMYANLLANSMNKVVKNGVHPGFVEIIKQLCPDEAKILKFLAQNETIPTITLRYEDDNGWGVPIVKNFTNIGELAKCEDVFETNKYFDNFIRLGLLESSPVSFSLKDKSLYEPLKNHPYIQEVANNSMAKSAGFSKHIFKEGFMRLTDYGKAFCGICISKIKVVVMEQ